MSIRRNPNASATNANDVLPPPPPYQPIASSGGGATGQQGAQQPHYAPPPGPPPGHYQSNNPFSDPSPRPPPNLMDADPRSYISSPSSYNQAPTPAPAPVPAAGTPLRQGSVSAHANRLSQDGSNGRTSTVAGSGTGATRRQPSVKENQLEFLKSYDTIFIVDDSSSMNVNERPDGSIGQSRWEEARDALAGMVQLAAQFDDDGIDIHFINSDHHLLDCRDPSAVKSLFDSIIPEGTTPIGTKLEMLLLQYMDDIETYKANKVGKEPKKRNYVCITDGAATDDPESVIIATARRLDQGRFPLAQIGVQFVQVGNDAEAAESLKELDDALSSQHSIRDIVDTVPYENLALNPETLIKALLGGINRRVDRRQA